MTGSPPPKLWRSAVHWCRIAPYRRSRGYRYIAAETGAFVQSAYASEDGSLIQAQHAPGTDKRLPDHSLDGTSGA